MSVTDKLKNSITAITGRQVYVVENAKIEADKLLMNAELPCVFMYVDNQRQVLAVGGQYVEQITATLLFVEQTKYKASDENNKTIQEAERQTALNFFAELRNRHTYESVDLLQSSEVYDGFRRIATGYALQVRVCELYGVCADGGGEYSRELSITANGTYDVVDYDKAVVNVPSLWVSGNTLFINVESEENKIIVNEI